MQLPGDDSRALERRFYADLARQPRIRVVVRALVLLEDHILLQRLLHDDANWFFPGGELEFGEQLEEGVRRELAEETTIEIRRVTYRFTANNRYQHDGIGVHMLEHFFEVAPASFEVESLEPPVLAEWHPIDRIRSLDVRPWGVRDALGIDGWRTVRLLEVS